MDSYYSQFIAEFPWKTTEQLNWLIEEIRNPTDLHEARRENKILPYFYVGDPDDEWALPSFNTQTDWDKFYIEGRCNAYEVLLLAAVYARKFGFFHEEPFILSVAHTSTLPSPGAFGGSAGGSAYCIFKDRAFYVDTADSTHQWLKQEEQAVTIMNTWQEAYA